MYVSRTPSRERAKGSSAAAGSTVLPRGTADVATPTAMATTVSRLMSLPMNEICIAPPGIQCETAERSERLGASKEKARGVDGIQRLCPGARAASQWDAVGFA